MDTNPSSLPQGEYLYRPAMALPNDFTLDNNNYGVMDITRLYPITQAEAEFIGFADNATVYDYTFLEKDAEIVYHPQRFLALKYQGEYFKAIELNDYQGNIITVNDSYIISCLDGRNLPSIIRIIILNKTVAKVSAIWL